MDRDIPAFNQLIVNKIHQKNKQLHEQRLHNIRTSQNSRSFVSSSMNTRQNRKAQQLEQDKKTEIEKHNIMLFNRMKKIMNRQDPHNKPVLQNHKNYNRMSMELTKIEQQNRTMYDRIQKQRPTINNKKFYQERQKQLNLLKFLGKYSSHSIQSLNAQNHQNLRSSQTSNKTQNQLFPEGARKKAYTTKPEHYLQNTETQIYSNSKPRYQQIQFDEEINDQDFKRIKELMQVKKKQKSALQYRQQESGYQSNKESVKVTNNITTRPSIPISAKDIILYKSSKSIDSQLYQIKILRKHLTYEIRCNLINAQHQPIVLELSEQEGNNLLQQTNYNYKSLVDSLHLVNNTIVLGYHQSQPFKDQPLHSQMQQQAYTKNKKPNRLLYVNSSHISEQNEEDSCQVQPIYKKKPTGIDALESLGEEQIQNYTAEEINEESNQPIFSDNPNNFQQKLQLLSQDNHFQKGSLQQGNKYEVEAREYEQSFNQSHKNNGNYQQALNEQVD